MGRIVDRQEGQDGDHRRSQQRESRRGTGPEDGHPLAHAALHGDERRIRDDDGIVHQHTHGDDDRRERHALQGDPLNLHDHQRGEDRKDQSAADQQAVAQADEEEQDGDNRQHRNHEVPDETAVGHLGFVALIVDRMEGITLGQGRGKGVDAVGHRPGHLHDVARRDRGDGHAQGRTSVDAHEVRGRTGIALLDAGDIPQPEVLTRRRGDRHLPDVVQRTERTGRFDPQPALPGLQRPGIDHAVLLGEGPGDVRGGQPAAGQESRRHRDLDRRMLRPPNLHARDILHRQQFVLEALGLVVQLAPGMALARQSVEDPEHVAEVVVHHRRARPVGQTALDIGDLPPQLVPQLLHLVGTHLLLDVDRDLRHADAVLALQVIEFVERLDRLLQQVRDLVAHLFGRCAGIGRHDQRLLDGEGGILEFAHVRIGEEAAEEHQHEQQPGHRLVLQKVFYQCIHVRDRVLRCRSR